MSEQMSEAQAIIEFAERRTTPQIFRLDTEHSGDVPFFVNRDGAPMSLMSIEDERRNYPRRRRGEIVVTTAASFIELVNRDKNDGESVVFASTNKLTAVLNFHSADGVPGFCDARIAYPFQFSEEWMSWFSKSGVKMDQRTFAEFIEDRAFDVGVPGEAGEIASKWSAQTGVRLAGPGELSTLGEGLSVRVEETVENAYRQQSGESTIVHKTEHKDGAGQPLKVPGAFHIMIPIVKGGPIYSIPVRLRYRVSGKVTWFYEMHRPDIFVEHALQETIKAVKEACGLPVIHGSI